MTPSKRTPIFVLGLVAALAAGFAAGVLIGGTDGPAPAAAPGEREILYWRAPMDPNYRRDEPGKSPMGMDLVPVYADEAAAGDDDAVRINPAVVNNLGVRTALAERGPLARRIDTVGYVSYDETTLQHIHTRVDGWVEQLAVKAQGDPVTTGQVLFELYSPTLVNAQEEYLAARQSRSDALRRASRERLLALGIPAGQIERLDSERSVTQRIRVIAAADGVVAQLGVREGKYVTPDTDILSIADLGSVWVLAEVFERQSTWVRAGLRAEVELDYLPGSLWEGRVDYVYPELDPASRTLTVRVRFDNADGTLRPNMFARVRIEGVATTPVVHVPREALIRGSRQDRVVLALGAGHFRSQPVATGIEAGGRVEITRGLEAGQRIVTSGQFLIDSESNVDSALSRMEDRGEGHEGHDMPMPDGGQDADEEPMDHSMHDMDHGQ